LQRPAVITDWNQIVFTNVDDLNSRTETGTYLPSCDLNKVSNAWIWGTRSFMSPDVAELHLQIFL